MWKYLDNFIDYLKSERRYSPHTLQSYRTDLSQFLEFLEAEIFSDQVNPDLVDSKHIKKFVEILFIHGLNKKSIARKLSAIKSFFKYLKRIQVIHSNSITTVYTPKLDKPLPVILDERQAHRLMELPPEDTFEGIRDRAILELLYGCGIRLGELLALKMKQIQFTSGCPNNCAYCYEPKEIKVYDPKIPKANYIQILDMNFLANPKAKDILRSLPKRKWEFICGIDYRRLDQEICNLLKKKGFVKIRWAWDYAFNHQKIHNRVWRMFKKAGFKSEELSVFILVNWKIAFRECIRKLDLLKVWIVVL